MRVAVVSRDLMDRSKILAVVEASAGEVVPPADADLVLGDVRQVTPEQVSSWVASARVVVFGPHVDTHALAEMRAAGAEALPRSRFFAALPDLLTAQPSKRDRDVTGR